MSISKTDALNELWRRGNLSWKLHEGQKDLYELYHNTNNKINVWLLGRRSGKSFGLCVIAIEACLKNPNIVIKFVSPTKTQVDQNVRPLFRKILEDCPKQFKPKFVTKDYIYYFPNGSEIQLAGTDNGHAERLRGSDSYLAIVDEAGSCDDLANVVKSILLPSTLTTKGKIILAGTPPKTYDHDFINFINDAESKDTLIKKPSNSNPLISKEEFDLLVQELGGLNSDECKRELFCMIIKDSNLSAIPEFDTEIEKELCVDWIKPPFYDCYVGMDLGGRDFTGVVFAYFDFKNDKVVFEDEILLDFQQPGVNLPMLVKSIQDKELIHFLDIKTQEQRPPAARVSDLNPIVTQEISRLSHNELNFILPTVAKKDKDAALNKLRLMISNKKIIINPRCKQLIRQLRNVRWKSQSNKKEFARTVDDSHYDLVDACIYLINSIYYTKNPYPAYYNFNSQDLFIKNPSQNQQLSNSNYIEVFKKIFNQNKAADNFKLPQPPKLRK